MVNHKCDCLRVIPIRGLCKTSIFVEITEGEKLTRRNIIKYFEDLILSLTYAAAASAKRGS